MWYIANAVVGVKGVKIKNKRYRGPYAYSNKSWIKMVVGESGKGEFFL